MGYHEARLAEIRAAYDRRLTEFVERYRPGAPTVIFLPGGMGSQLRISLERYGAGDTMPGAKSVVAWYDAGLLFEGDLSRLELRREQGEYEDLERHAVIPDGEVRYLYKPYDGLERCLVEAGYNYAVFGFDWRRPLTENVSFLRHFLAKLTERVERRHGEDPRPATTLVGHSQGGLVLHLWLLREFRGRPTAAEVAAKISRVICVGAPFYGTSNHLSRYYQGDPAFNLILGLEKVQRILCSMPGPYVLMPMDEQTFEERRAEFEADDYLASSTGDPYPVRDADDLGRRADPYAAPNWARYPGAASHFALAEAAQMRATLRRRLPDAVIPRVFCLRSVADRETLVELHWKGDPRAGATAVLGVKGPGDGSVPAWSGALTELPRPEQVVDLVEADGHVGLMEHPETLGHLFRILEGDHVPALRLPDGAPRLPRAELQLLCEDARESRIDHNDERLQDPALWRRLLEESTR